MEEQKTSRPIAAQIRDRRIEQKLTQEELAEKSGLQQSVIARIENGHVASTPTLRAIARALQFFIIID